MLWIILFYLLIIGIFNLKFLNYDKRIHKISNNSFSTNGSLNNIAVIFNKNKNILGMMPHPERMADKTCSNEDGLSLFLSLMN